MTKSVQYVNNNSFNRIVRNRVLFFPIFGYCDRCHVHLAEKSIHHNIDFILTKRNFALSILSWIDWQTIFSWIHLVIVAAAVVVVPVKLHGATFRLVNTIVSNKTNNCIKTHEHYIKVSASDCGWIRVTLPTWCQAFVTLLQWLFRSYRSHIITTYMLMFIYFHSIQFHDESLKNSIAPIVTIDLALRMEESFTVKPP